jgi:2-phosphosulfolactate phosphatase
VIDVALTPAELRPADVAVVIDVLRAGSTVVTALAAGYERVLLAASVGRARELRGPGRVLAGEQRCVQPAGFDQGNSPLEAALRRGDELVLATTNGTPAVLAAARVAPTVVIACMLNLAAVVGELAGVAGDIQIVCSGTDGEVALEDTYVAGRIVAALDAPRTDAARVAEAVARAYGSPLAALGASADARVLRSVGLADDISFCARESKLSVVPHAAVLADGVAVAVAVAGSPRNHTRVGHGDTVAV